MYRAAGNRVEQPDFIRFFLPQIGARYDTLPSTVGLTI